MKEFICTNKKEMNERGIEQVDFVLISGDAYVDHPSFGASLIARYLELYNFSVAIIAQPDIFDGATFLQCGLPRLAFLVTSGNMDSMVNHYYVSKKRRKKDSYTVNERTHKRPDYATSRYASAIRDLGYDIPIIIGGIEASLRRFTHYDFWKNRLLPSILIS
ncbi:MAG: YgiQ family radical SAM protein, partial [Bacilli bacterium]